MLRSAVRLLALTLLLLVAAPVAAQPPAAPLPKVVLVGDSIRLGYAPLVAKKLEGKAVVVSPAANGGDSANVLKHLDEWVARERPDLVHVNCGLHDLKLGKATKKHQVELDDYRQNLRRIVDRIRSETGATVVFANTTPIHDERHARRNAEFDRTDAAVLRYNEAARDVMSEAGVPVHDLHTIVRRGGVEALLTADGTHYTPAGNELLAGV